MPADKPATELTVDARRAIFRAVVEAQDAGSTVAESRADAGRRFGVTEDQVRAVEREGVQHDWPPL
ncbi:MAG: hypothetical protein U0871_17460 [Gemmataceae bacterium]